jgi:tryptophanyl-tRNA synthetase
VIMSIKTDSTAMEEPKEPETCPVYRIYRALAGADDTRTSDLAAKYRGGNFGYGHAKQALFELLLDHFGPARSRREALMADPGYVDGVLKRGAEAARMLARATVDRAREAVGL